MTTVSHALRQPVKDFLCTLHAKFSDNVHSIQAETLPLLDTIDLNSRIIYEIRTILSKDYCDNESQKRICKEILEEVFGDFSLAMYLCAIGLIVPARMSVRRAFELGLATVYMWDLPHEYWGWRNRDQDLSFSAMVTHLNSLGYLDYIGQLQGIESVPSICNQAKFQSLYRELSNTVHGKISGLPPLSPERFTPDKNEIEKHLKQTIEAQKFIIGLLFGRFQKMEPLIEAAFPQIKRT
ncbi:hypothetical protein [Nitrosomonas ureae]|uniref:Uncharacterized protein n=1 Tax=Nitrosomonas ureae TaxID=44577 RepID=A0A1H2HRM6_9PROT|nr:hypothetical protein [Nitrosomonas ureae]ALQ51372.1 hypothetical protein ATY38_09180 [Nitrosomonas ureae]SDU34464.1 hypothetical protein SAMN05216406_1615 [Nitrosomonas ureae]